MDTISVLGSIVMMNSLSLTVACTLSLVWTPCFRGSYVGCQLFDSIFVKVKPVHLVSLLGQIASHVDTHVSKPEETHLILVKGGYRGS